MTRLLSETADLTSKEWAITALVSRGTLNIDIATIIHAPEPVVKDHLLRILEKTGCWNRTEIALWYLKLGLENERRFSDRRNADSRVHDERQRGRRHAPKRSPRGIERRSVNLDE